MQGTFREWLVQHPVAWHGWPTRTLYEDDFDVERLCRMKALVTFANLLKWFGADTIKRDDRLFGEISSEIADLRLLRRREYASRVEGVA